MEITITIDDETLRKELLNGVSVSRCIQNAIQNANQRIQNEIEAKYIKSIKDSKEYKEAYSNFGYGEDRFIKTVKSMIEKYFDATFFSKVKEEVNRQASKKRSIKSNISYYLDTFVADQVKDKIKKMYSFDIKINKLTE